mgnify:CR=1 FL=1
MQIIICIIDRYKWSYTFGTVYKNFFDNGFLLCKEDSTFSSQVGCLFYEHYDRLDQLNDRIMNESDKIQCVVSRDDQIKNRIDFGKTQEPQLWDYPDNIDTLKFLINL